MFKTKVQFIQSEALRLKKFYLRKSEPVGETEGCKRCNCKKSKCLKLVLNFGDPFPCSNDEECESYCGTLFIEICSNYQCRCTRKQLR
ncbi:unnamed protein product [Trifolium pratense]|uniref:Uncharacterized protein n=1 Tax=Trifolium pratense TaxID=57577 RepID=A0ACB0JEK4_TRIPR|nr:unnamed protein product [Trifolium pratense]